MASLLDDPRALARTAGAVYALNIVTGALAAAWTAKHMADPARAAVLVSAVAYAAVTLLLYRLTRPAGPALAAAAAAVSLAGCALSIADSLGLVAAPMNPLVAFGLYCLMLGALVWRSTFLPRLLGLLLALGGLGWLSFAFPGTAARLVPWNMFPGVIAETIFTLWLLIAAVDAERWRARAAA